MIDAARANLLGRARELAPGAAPALLRGLAPFAGVIALAVLAQVLVRPHVDPYWSGVTLTIGINVVLAVSLTIVNGLTGQFSMGHAGFMAAGGYAAAGMTYYASLLGTGSARAQESLLSGMPLRIAENTPFMTSGDLLFAASLVTGGLFAALLGLLVGLPSLRLRGDYLAIVTLGFGEIVRVLITQTGPVLATQQEARDASFLQVATGLGGALGFGSRAPLYTSWFWVLLVAGITLVVAVRLKRSTYGRAFLSIREDEIASEAMGVSITRYKVWAFVIAAFFAGVAGGLFAHTLTGGLSPGAAGFQRSFDVIIMVVLGGLGSISGATIAAVILTVLPEYLRAIEDYRLVVFALLLVLMMIFRPQGLLGVREIWERSLWRSVGATLKRLGARVGIGRGEGGAAKGGGGSP